MEQLQITYPFLSVKKNKKNGTYLIDIPQEKTIRTRRTFQQSGKGFPALCTQSGYAGMGK